MKLYLDIETLALPPEDRLFDKPVFEKMSFGNTKDPVKKQNQFEEAIGVWETGSRAALKATTGEVALIGFADDDGDYQHHDCSPEEEGEVGGLKSFLVGLDDRFRDKGLICIGHNSVRFDVPFIIRRSLILGVEVPDWIINDLNQYRRKLMKDTMLYWQFGDRQHNESLERLCGAFGIAVKESPVTGATFYEWWAKDKPEAITYNKNDVLAVRELSKRMRL